MRGSLTQFLMSQITSEVDPPQSNETVQQLNFAGLEEDEDEIDRLLDEVYRLKQELVTAEERITQVERETRAEMSLEMEKQINQAEKVTHCCELYCQSATCNEKLSEMFDFGSTPTYVHIGMDGSSSTD